MTDRDFLLWLHERLVNVHGEREHMDYMHKLRAIIHDMPADRTTPNDGRGKNSGIKTEKFLHVDRGEA